MSCGETVFVAGIRRNLYIWNIHSAQLVRTVDAHFGRILNLQSLNINNHNLLISSSIDRSIKMWNMENIFEKSFALENMDEPIEKILIARNKPNLAIAQTRKYLGIWTSGLTDSSPRYLIVWDLKTHSVNHRLHAPHVHQIVFLDNEKLIGVVFRQQDTPEQKMARFTVYRVVDLTVYFTHEYQCRMFRNLVVLKDTTTVVAVVFFKGHDHLNVIEVAEKVVRQKFRPRAVRKQQKDIIVLELVAGSSNHCVVMDMRYLPSFTGVVTADGKLGLDAPTKGGLHIVDMKTGNIARTLIGKVAEGVNDVQAHFTPKGDHVLYYHTGQQTLRAFRVADGMLIGTLRPHAQITTWSCDYNGEKVVIGCQDGSLLTSILYDVTVHPLIQKTLGSLLSRRYLAEHLGMAAENLEREGNMDLRNLGVITKAITKFKQPLRNRAKGSVVCCMQ
uniref:NWD2 C-terminal beta-propeller domain-containing protein n=1 Tax=Ditylenchus dipsaci TaxID=166011 RepID=A0A915E369_9BILA